MKRLLILLVLAAVMVGPASTLAQQTPPPMKEFTSQDGKLTLSYPTDWVAGDGSEDVPLPNAVVANSQDALDRVLNSQDPVSGDALIEILVFPTDLLSLTGAQLPEQPTLDDYTTALATLFVGPETPTVGAGTPTPEGPQISKAQEIILGENIQAGMVEVSDSTAQGAFIVHALSDKLLVITFVATYPGEYTQSLAQIGQDVAATVKYSGTAEDVMAPLMAGEEAGAGTPEATPTQPGATGATLNGEQLVSERCTVCHSIDRIKNKMASGADRSAWQQTVDRMISYGAQLNADERQAVIDYLVAQSSAPAAPAATPTTASSTSSTLNGEQLVSERCTVCHSIDRINRKIASGADRAAWEQTVDRMISHGAKLNADERQAVIDYLVAQSSK